MLQNSVPHSFTIFCVVHLCLSKMFSVLAISYHYESISYRWYFLFLFFMMIFSYHQQWLLIAAETVCAIAGTLWKALLLEEKKKTTKSLLFKFSRWRSSRVHYIMNIKGCVKLFSLFFLDWNIVSLHSLLDIIRYSSSFKLKYSILQYAVTKGLHL